MTDLSNNNWSSMSDSVLEKRIGEFVRYHRLEKNKTQEELARAAGISRSTLSLLENGETVTIATLIQVIRVLDQLQIMETFIVHKNSSPIELAKIEQGKKQRVRNKNTDDQKKSDW